MANISNNDIASAIYLFLKDKHGVEYDEGLKDVRKFLFKRKLISKTPLILESLKKVINKDKGITEASVISTEELDSGVRNKLVSSISKMYKTENVALEEKVDEKMIGGIKLQIEDEVFDLTILNKLKKLEKQLIR